MKREKYIYILFTFLLLSQACVHEDRSDCPPGILIEDDFLRTLHFKTIPDKYNFEALVETVTLYVYDDDEDRLQRTYRVIDLNEFLTTDFRVILSEWEDLPDDNYHMIGVMNMNDHYQILGEHRLDEYQTHILELEDEELNDVFIGYINLSAVTRAEYRDTMYLEKLVNRIHLSVEFLDNRLAAGYTLSSYLTGSNAEYDYLNNSLGHNQMTYVPYFHDTDHQSLFYFDIATGKLVIGDDLSLVIEIYDANGELIQTILIPLTEEIANLTDNNGYYLYDTNEKLQAEDEFYLYIIFNDDFTIAEFRINDWFLVDPDIDV